MSKIIQGRRTTTENFLASLWKSTPQDNIVDGQLIQQQKKSQSENKTSHQEGIFTYGQMTTFRIIGVLVSYAGYLAFNSLQLLYLILAGILISVAMEVFVSRGSKYMPRGLSIGLTYLLLILFILTGVFIILPFLIQQLTVIINMIVAQFSAIGQEISILGLQGYILSQDRLGSGVQEAIINFINAEGVNSQRLQSTVIENISSFVSTGSDYVKNLGGILFSIIGSIFSIGSQIGLVLTIAVFFSIEKDSVRNFLVRYFSSSPTSHMNHTIDIFYNKMGSWIKTQFALCLYIGVLVYIMLLIISLFGIDLPNKLALALMAGFTEIIPYVGPILGSIPALIIATITYGRKGLVVVGLAYFIIQWTENNILIPLTMNKSLGVSPLLILLSALLGASILGFIGVLLAVPFAIIITIISARDDQSKKS